MVARMRGWLIFVLMALTTVLWGCSNDEDSSTTPPTGTGGLAPKLQVEQGSASLDIGPYIASVRIHLWNNIDLDTTASVPYGVGGAAFSGITPGDVYVLVEGLDAGQNVLCRGADTVTIEAGVVADPTIVLEVLVPFIMYTDSPSDGDTVYTDSVVMSGTVRSMNTLAFIRVGQTVVQPDTAGAWSLTVGLTEGLNSFVVQARDVNNAEGRDTVAFWYVDTSGPEVTITPADSSVSSADSVLVAVTAEDPSGISTVTINGAPATMSGDGWTAWVALNGASSQVTIAAIDDAVAQNATIESIVILYDAGSVDTLPPTLAITSPSRDTTVYDTAGVLISGLATDAGSGIAQVLVSGVEASYSTSNGLWSATYRPMVEGSNLVRVVATDNAGQQATDSIAVIYTTAPEPPAWNTGSLSLAMNEGETVMLSLPDSCSNPDPANSPAFSLADQSALGELSADTYVLTAGVRTAGTHVDSLVVTAAGLSDTMTVTVTIAPTFYTLSTSTADLNGSVSPAVADSTVRWGDTVTVLATPNQNYEFDFWDGTVPAGDAGNASIKVVIDTDKNLTAHFVQSLGCQTVNPSQDLNAVMQSVHSGALGALPVQLCPEEGDYLNGTAKVRIHGRIRITIE